MIRFDRFCAVLLVVVSMTAAAPCRAQDRIVSLARYDSLLKAVRDKVVAASAEVDNGNNPSAPLPGVFAKRLLAGVDGVRMPDGGVVQVHNRSLLSAISGVDKITDSDDQESGYDAVAARIEFLRNGFHEQMGLPPVEGTTAPDKPISPDKARDLARRILSGPAYSSDPVPPPSWAQREMNTFEKWFGRVLNKLLKPNAPVGPGPNINWRVIMWTFFWILIAAVFVLLVWIISQVIGRRQVRAKALSLSSSETAILEARDKETLLTLAERHAKSGEYRAAFRLVYLATLIVLDTGGVLRFDRSKTNWEYVRQLRNTGRQDVSDVLTPLTREFDRIWYGQASAGPEVYHRAVREYEKLTEAPVEKATAATA